MKKRRIQAAGVVILLAVILWSCKDDESSAPAVPKHLTFSVPAEFIAEDMDCWIIISDASGNVLDTARLKNDNVYTFESSPGFTDNNVTVTLLQHTPPSEYRPEAFNILNTYTNVPFGAYGYESPPDTSTPPRLDRKVEVTVSDFGGGFLDIRVSGPRPGVNSWNGSLSPVNGLQIDFIIDERKPVFLLSLLNDGVWSYRYEAASAGQSLAYTMADFSRYALSPIEVPAADNISYTLMGTNEYGDFSPFLWEDNVPVTGTSFDLPYPKDIFTSYRTEIMARKGDVYDYFFPEIGPLPKVMKTIDGSINYKVSGNVIESVEPESCDVVTYTASKNNDPGTEIVWNVYCGPGNRSVVLPVFPKPLMDTYQIASFADMYADAYAFSATLSESSSYAKYDDFLKSTLGTESLASSSNESMDKTKYENSRSQGGRAAFVDHSKELLAGRLTDKIRKSR